MHNSRADENAACVLDLELLPETGFDSRRAPRWAVDLFIRSKVLLVLCKLCMSGAAAAAAERGEEKGEGDCAQFHWKLFVSRDGGSEICTAPTTTEGGSVGAPESGLVSLTPALREETKIARPQTTADVTVCLFSSSPVTASHCLSLGHGTTCAF